SSILRPVLPATVPAQLLIQVVRMSAHAASLDSQQLWPPSTFVTISESCGEVSVTTVFASAYARLMSSLRANIGAWPPSTLWHAPQRLLLWMLSRRLSLKECRSAVAGGGPSYAGEGGPPSLGFSTVGAPLPPLHAASTVAAAATVRPTSGRPAARSRAISVLE